MHVTCDHHDSGTTLDDFACVFLIHQILVFNSVGKV